MTFEPRVLFVRYLERLQHLVKVSEIAGLELLSARLAPDMLPFANQVSAAAGFALRACCPLAGKEVVRFSRPEPGFAVLLEELKDTRAYLEELPALNLEMAGLLEDKAGFETVSLPAGEFLYCYALPNFFFHFSMAYAIARQQGVVLSKADFDGYHTYPVGFSFNS